MKGAHGKALFLRGWQNIDRDPAVAATTYASWGFRWAVLPLFWSNGAIANVDAAVPMRRIGVSPWLLGYFTPGNWQRLLPTLLDTAKQVGATGVVLDVEAEWKGNHGADALAFAQAAADGARARGLRIMITGFGGGPKHHATFPWREFARFIPAAIPQLYDRNVDFNPAYMTESIQSYREAGFTDITPAGSAWNDENNTHKSLDQFQRHLELIPPTPGVVFWYNPPKFSDGLPEELRQALRRWRPRSTYPRILDVVLGQPLAEAIFGG